MRAWIDLITEAVDLPWGFGNAGCWVLPSGEVLPCDYEADIHHGDIVYQTLDLDADDPDQLDEFVAKGVEQGWVRMRMSSQDFCIQCDPHKINRKQMAMIPRLEQGGHSRYVLENQWPHSIYPTMGKMMLALRAAVSGEKA